MFWESNDMNERPSAHNIHEFWPPSSFDFRASHRIRLISRVISEQMEKKFRQIGLKRSWSWKMMIFLPYKEKGHIAASLQKFLSVPFIEIIGAFIKLNKGQL